MLTKIKNEFFISESLLPLGWQGLKQLVKNANSIDIFLSLYETDPYTTHSIFSYVQKEERDRTLNSLAVLGYINLEKVKTAQLRILKIIAQLQLNKFIYSRKKKLKC